MDGGGGAPAKAGRANNLPFREDCWTEEETATLIEAWGERYVDLNRGNLRQKHWEEVADVVNGRHAAAGKRPRRTDIQCKNRIDTIKKKFKLEKSRLASSPPGAASKWLFFDRVATLIGPAAAFASASAGPVKKKPASPPPPPPVAVPLPFRKQAGEAPPLAQAVVVKKRPSPAVENSYPRRGFGDFNGGYGGSPAMDVDVDVESDSSRSRSDSEEAAEEEEEEEEGNGFRQLARAIARFAEIYERVEEAKQKQVFELEKQRMEFAKGLEYQRMQLFVDSQVNLEKMKRARRSSGTTDHFL